MRHHSKAGPVAARSKAWVCGHSTAATVGSNPAGGSDVCLLCVLSGRGLCDGLITRPEESYRLWCVVACARNLKNEEAMARVGPQEKIYRVSQEECARLRESVPYVKLYRYNPKHLYPKLNGYGDNGHRKVWASGGSTYCTPSVTPYSSTAHARQRNITS